MTAFIKLRSETGHVTVNVDAIDCVMSLSGSPDRSFIRLRSGHSVQVRVTYDEITTQLYEAVTGDRGVDG